MASATVEDAPSTLLMHTFRDEILTFPVEFQVLKLKDSLFIWIGGESMCFADLSIAIPMNNEVTSTRVLGSVHMQTPSDSMGKRISTKLKKPVYLSYNLPVDDVVLMKAVEKRLHSEIMSKPDSFI